MQSAEEHFKELNKIADPYWDEGNSPFEDELIGLIRARDQEIIEACKEAVRNEPSYVALKPYRDRLICALDSVLSDLG